MGGFFIGEEMWETSGASAENLGGGGIFSRKSRQVTPLVVDAMRSSFVRQITDAQHHCIKHLLCGRGLTT